jgi:hypothetical protein
MLTKIIVAAALIVGSVSATLANDTGKASRHARASYAQGHVQPSRDANPALATGQRPLTQFESNWFDFQNHE